MISREAPPTTSSSPAFASRTPVTKDGQGRNLCGRGDLIVFEDSDFLNCCSDMESIVWLRETGHNLGLCHLPDDHPPVVTGPVGWGGCTCCKDECNCTHYSNDTWNDSAMGSGTERCTFPRIDDVIENAYGAVNREIDCADSEWKVIDLTPISGVENPVDGP